MTLAPIKWPFFSLLLASATALSGCAEPASPPAPPVAVQASPRIQVQKQTETYTLPLASDGSVAPLERERLRAFITALADDRPEALHVQINGSTSLLQLRRIAALLEADGVASSKILGAPDGRGGSAVTITVDRYTATAPGCAPWSTAIASQSEDNAPGPEFGCSVLADFAAMLADPHDLIKGSTDRMARGTPAALAVQRYNEDKVKPLDTTQQGFSVNLFNNLGGANGASPQH